MACSNYKILLAKDWCAWFKKKKKMTYSPFLQWMHYFLPSSLKDINKLASISYTGRRYLDHLLVSTRLVLPANSGFVIWSIHGFEPSAFHLGTYCYWKLDLYGLKSDCAVVLQPFSHKTLIGKQWTHLGLPLQFSSLNFLDSISRPHYCLSACPSYWSGPCQVCPVLHQAKTCMLESSTSTTIPFTASSGYFISLFKRQSNDLYWEQGGLL